MVPMMMMMIILLRSFATTALKLVTWKHCKALQTEQENANIKGDGIFTDKNTIYKYEARPDVKHGT
jgi:hypothetical protein